MNNWWIFIYILIVFACVCLISVINSLEKRIEILEKEQNDHLQKCFFLNNL